MYVFVRNSRVRRVTKLDHCTDGCPFSSRLQCAIPEYSRRHVPRGRRSTALLRRVADDDATDVWCFIETGHRSRLEWVVEVSEMSSAE